MNLSTCLYKWFAGWIVQNGRILFQVEARFLEYMWGEMGREARAKF